MFIGGTDRGQHVRENTSEGLWGLDRCTPQFRAWRYWRLKEFDSDTNCKAITATSEWPPTTIATAQAYAKWLSGIRDEVKNPHGVPRHPDPWDGTIPPPYEEQPNETP